MHNLTVYVRSADERMSNHRLGAKETTKTQISQFDHKIRRHKNIGRFNILN